MFNTSFGFQFSDKCEDENNEQRDNRQEEHIEIIGLGKD